jgi:CRISPR type III-B/RAMP module RAMP protein Cmr6
MPTLMPKDTRTALGSNAERCDSRSLFLDRFAYPGAKDSGEHHPRRDWFNALRGKPVWPSAGNARREWLTSMAEDEGGQLLYAQLQSRLMVNMAGGVMENAGLCLDRFGLPYLPGSAVKGCARRAALAALHEWCEAGGKPEHKPSGDDNVFTSACASFASPADLLAAIARVFGWCEQDWSLARKEDRYVADFAWACGSAPEAIWKAAAEKLAGDFGWRIDDKHHSTPWKSLPNFAGNVSFLPAYPVDLGRTGRVDGLPTEVPALGKLELDVVTCHHGEYYRGNPAFASAPDSEEPVPVLFPAVASGHVFTFAVHKLRTASADDLQRARAWLHTGLQTFGLGAKTSAGYGWFDCSESLQQVVKSLLQAKEERERADTERKAAEEKAAAEAKARADEKAAREAALAGLSPEQRADKEVELMTEPQFDAKVRAFFKEPKRGGPTEEQKKAIVRALRGSRLTCWQDFKAKATKGDLAKAADAIRQLSRKMYPGNEGKMP